MASYGTHVFLPPMGQHSFIWVIFLSFDDIISFYILTGLFFNPITEIIIKIYTILL